MISSLVKPYFSSWALFDDTFPKFLDEVFDFFYAAGADFCTFIGAFSDLASS
jgi:hypothetical protein